MSIVHNDIFIFDNVISIYLKVSEGTLNHNCLLCGKLKWQNSFSEGHLRFLSKFPFVNLQIISIVESLLPVMSCTQSMKKISDLLNNMQFWVKIGFQKFSNFSESVG